MRARPRSGTPAHPRGMPHRVSPPPPPASARRSRVRRRLPPRQMARRAALRSASGSVPVAARPSAAYACAQCIGLPPPARSSRRAVPARPLLPPLARWRDSDEGGGGGETGRHCTGIGIWHHGWRVTTGGVNQWWRCGSIWVINLVIGIETVKETTMYRGGMGLAISQTLLTNTPTKPITTHVIVQPSNH